MRAVAVDRSSNRTSGPVTILDLTVEDDIVFLEIFIESEKSNIMLVHLAPPCGTSSAARNKRHPDLQLAGYTLPRPLRSQQYPMGLPELRGLDAAKVKSANTLYWATYRIAKLCIRLNITVSIENPQNSLFWLTDPMSKLFSEHLGFHNVFQACMMGGDRDKRTLWWCSDQTFDSFNILCDGMHSHKAWKPVATTTGLRFPTAQEAEYPTLLCDRVAFIAKEKANNLGFVQTTSLIQQAKQHVNMGFLARGNKLKPLVSEFADYQTWLFNVNNNEEDVEKILRSTPKGAKLVHRKLVKLGEVRVGEVHGRTLRSGIGNNDFVDKISIGLPREREDFVKEAVRAGHPRFLDYKSVENVDFLLSRNLSHDVKKVVQERNAWLKRWTEEQGNCKTTKLNYMSLCHPIAPQS